MPYSKIGLDMVPDQIPEFAVESEHGTDVFRRVDTPKERRYHYECIATVNWSGSRPEVTSYHEDARKAPERMIAAATRLRETSVLGQGFVLGNPRSYPLPDTPGVQLDLFVYLDFFRHWQITAMEIARIKALVQSGGTLKPPDISRIFRLLLDANQVSQAQFFVKAFFPYLLRVSQEKKDDRWQNAAYALRMIGDLQLRAGQKRQALQAYEASIALADNPFRRGLAIQAAYAAGDRAAALRHIESYEGQWRLPERLATIKAVMTSSETGDVL
ncbi:hypothetical protein [Roseinatronobacter monicus]|uniref:hypothetical protein n=1 Tax=Roseinatronobacter monicus TaxID=393481 RepID=UPI003F2C21EE